MIKKLLIILVLFSKLLFGQQFYVNDLIVAHEKDLLYPLLSSKSKSITIPMAYNIQKQWVDYLLKTNKKIGYKAGLTSSSLQKKYNTNAPIFGVLVSNKAYQNFAVIPLKDHHNLHVEAELGFRLKKDITAPIESTYILQRLIKEAVIVAELPDLRLKQAKKATLSDIIAINSAANTIVVGDSIPVKDIDNLSIECKHNDTLLFSTKSNNIMEGQLNALKWLINSTLEKGWPVTKDDLFITGSLGEMMPAKVGRYVLNYGNEASIIFDIY